MSAAPTVVRVIDAAEENGTPQNQYFLSVLRLALDKSRTQYGEYWIEPIDLPIIQSRQFKELAKHNIDVFWTVATAQRNAEARPIPIPIAFGSFGVRLLAFNVADSGKFNVPLTLDEMKRFDILLGKDWPDVTIFNNSTFKVETYAHGAEIYRVLANTSGKVFPRGLIELLPELEAHKQGQVSYSKKHLFVYPSMVYFYIRKDDNGLYKRIKSGLELAMQDGTLHDLFYRSKLMREFKRIELNDAQIYRLDNSQIASKKQLEMITQLQTELLQVLGVE
ncbi:hypothetical protein [Pseudoalteromonas piscicida]|uniref:hypothetical protein n=1 Tax=Pseudoalteromonas piscicida TaxID=43662 RepID=UPI001F5B76B2|nr:hypothetical protein [Pseudoalteromonas piscicida]